MSLEQIFLELTRDEPSAPQLDFEAPDTGLGELEDEEVS